MNLDAISANIDAMSPDERAKFEADVMAATSHMRWVPSPGPQADAYYSKADILLYGGTAGSGKTDLGLGLAFTQHQHSLVMRRQYVDLSGITERAVQINGTRTGFNGSPPPKLRTTDARLIEFGACAKLGDEEDWQGRPRDLLHLDEAVQFLEYQVRFLMGWVRTTIVGQRARTILSTNPPLSADGDWVIGMFAPWLDITHPNPAKPGELRWFVSDPDGKDMEVPDSTPVQFPGQRRPTLPKSRTFIPGKLDDNPYLVRTDYASTLDAMPEPLRSAMRDGNFMMARKDDEWQVIPTEWIRMAQARWTPRPPEGVPMTSIGVDPSQGGNDDFIISPRHDLWFAEQIALPGVECKTGSEGAAKIIIIRRDNAQIVVDVGGGYGGPVVMRLEDNGIGNSVVAFNGTSKSMSRTRDGRIAFVNRRAAAYWKFREALDPDQEGGSTVALPHCQKLLSDLTAPRFQITARGIQVESKEEIKKRLGRSPDRGDAVVYSFNEGKLRPTGAFKQGSPGAKGFPKSVSGNELKRRFLHRK